MTDFETWLHDCGYDRIFRMLKLRRVGDWTPYEIKQKYIDLVPMKRSCKYLDIINIVEFLLSEKSSYMTGQSINVTGGQQLF